MDSITVEDICQRPVEKAINSPVYHAMLFIREIRSAGGESWLRWHQAYEGMIKHVGVLSKMGRSRTTIFSEPARIKLRDLAAMESWKENLFHQTQPKKTLVS